MTTLKLYLQHILNPLHIYCRLCDCGWSAAGAGRLCRTYERLVYRRLASGAGQPRSCSLP